MIKCQRGCKPSTVVLMLDKSDTKTATALQDQLLELLKFKEIESNKVIFQRNIMLVMRLVKSYLDRVTYYKIISNNNVTQSSFETCILYNQLCSECTPITYQLCVLNLKERELL